MATGSKGVAVGDYDNTGLLALLVTNHEGEIPSLYQSRAGHAMFHYVSRAAGLARFGQTTNWGTGFFDLDLDGHLDLFIATGHVLRHPTGKAKIAQQPILLRNEGGKFTEISNLGGPYFQKDHRGRGVAFGDLDNDGRIDLVISHLNEPVVLLRNEVKIGQNHWLGIELQGNSHRNVTGARIVLEADGLPVQTRYAESGGSFASASDPRLVFGLGKLKRSGKLTVRWPGGKEQSWEGLEIDRYYRLVEGQKEPLQSGDKSARKDRP